MILSMFSGRMPVLAMLICGLVLVGCASKDKENAEDTPEQTAEELYLEAHQAFADKKFKKAVELFDDVERQHPYSEWAIKAKVMAAYASYKARDYANAVGILERFVKLHPGSDSVPYAYYLIALCYYDQVSDVGRDQGMTERARDALDEVVRRFPNTDYAADAKIKLDLVHDHLAGKEMEVGRFYLHQGDYLAAINRFRYVVDRFQTTTHVPEALHRLTEAYLALGVREEATKYASVLGYNFPGSKWYQRSYALLGGEGTAPALDGKSASGDGDAAKGSGSSILDSMRGFF